MNIDKRQVAVLRCLLLALDEATPPRSQPDLFTRGRAYGARLQPPVTVDELRLAWTAAPRDLLWTDEHKDG